MHIDRKTNVMYDYSKWIQSVDHNKLEIMWIVFKIQIFIAVKYAWCMRVVLIHYVLNFEVGT